MATKKATKAAKAATAPVTEKEAMELAEDEATSEALIRLANKRVPRALKALDVVGNLGAYKPSEEQMKAIMEALDARLRDVQKRLEGKGKKAATFSL